MSMKSKWKEVALLIKAVVFLIFLCVIVVLLIFFVVSDLREISKLNREIREIEEKIEKAREGVRKPASSLLRPVLPSGHCGTPSSVGRGPGEMRSWGGKGRIVGEMA